jgi:RNA polymerase sigma-70 factor, ECF subfamily
VNERHPLLTKASDGSLIAASIDRPRVFASVFDRHFAAVHSYLARRAGREQADDLASLCFTVAFERRSSFDPRVGRALPWLLGIATNLLRDHWRSEQRLLETLTRLDPVPEAVSDEVTSGVWSAGDPALAQALAGLDAAQRDVLLLYAWAELSYDEIAIALAVPVGTVRSRLARARGQLRVELARSGGKATPQKEKR